jgi:antirestriction protein ArdC
MSRDIYQEVTDRIIASLEAGTVPWLRPWRDDKSGSALEPYNAQSGRPYNGVNLLILGTMPYADLGWLTFKQARELGGTVRKGEKGTTVIFWKFVAREDDDGKTRTVPVARAYTVFNVAQCDGLDAAKLKRPAAPVAGETDINVIAERAGAQVRHGGDKAFYTAGSDFIQLPSAGAFRSADHYQSTLAHELTHWTGHASRCAREFGRRFGDQAYAFEELVAEIGSAFLCARIGLALEGLQHTAYLASWLTVLHADKRAIFTASSKAKQAAEFILKSDAEPNEDPEEIQRLAA